MLAQSKPHANDEYVFDAFSLTSGIITIWEFFPTLQEHIQNKAATKLQEGQVI